jgi:predicted RNA-binding Zn-ribbon protein involved in translation (DUF1610 family)
MRQVADATVCENCGVILGAEACDLADETCMEESKRFADLYPGIKRRMVRQLYAVCSECGKKYSFNEKANAFEALAVPPRESVGSSWITIR